MQQPVGGQDASALLVAFDKSKQLLVDDVGAQVDTFVADIHGRSSYQFSHFVLVLAAERAIEEFRLRGLILQAEPECGRAASILADRIFQFS